MKRLVILTLIVAFSCFDFARASSVITVKDRSSQTEALRLDSKSCQKLEEEISKLEDELNEVEKREKSCTPVIQNIHEILTRCFTVLFDIQRFSPLLVLSSPENRNDFIRCSVVIKNFVSYFKNVSSQLHNSTSMITKLKQEKENCRNRLKQALAEYTALVNKIQETTSEILKSKEETIIQNIVYHIATKSASIEELDAELESENAVGVLKNTRIATNLKLEYPVSGRIVTEFGDKSETGEMVYYTAFECRSSAVVTSPAKGLVVFSGSFLNYGNMVIISNGDYRIFLYGLDSIFVRAGDVIEIGDYIGKMGDDFRAGKTATLRLELRRSGEPLDARQWLQQNLGTAK